MSAKPICKRPLANAIICSVPLLTWSATSIAAVSGEAEVGASLARGNTDVTTVTAKVNTDYAPNATWNINTFANGLYTESADVKTADSLSAGIKPQYFLDDKNYLFGLLQYDTDEFSGIEEQYSEILGYGRHVLDTDAQQLKLEVGAGARQTDYVDGTEAADEFDESEAVLFLSANYAYKISDTAKFTQTLRVDSGEENTATESVTGMSFKVAGNFLTKLSLTVNNNSDVTGAEGEHTDSLLAVSLLYSY